MILRRFRNAVIATLLVFTVGAAPLSAARWEDPTELYKAYYLEHQAKDYAAARKLYEVAMAQSLSAELKRAARCGADRCRDNIAAQNFAQLMPENAMAYFELNRPGEVIEKLCGMLGLTGKDIHDLLAQRPSTDSTAPFRIPEEVVVSPAIFEAFNSFGGGAVALTSFDPSGRNPPTGVMVLHHGDTNLFRGIIETTFQFSPTTEKIAELPTFGSTVPDLGKITGVLTEGLFIAGTDRDLVEGVVGRLVRPGKASLATREDLKEIVEQRTGATLFAYADLQAILKLVKANLGEADQRDYAMANAIADLDSLRWATFSAGIHDGTMSAQLAVRLANDHHSIAYNLMRLPPMSRRSMAGVPADVAGLFAFGLNPTLASAVVDKAKEAGAPEDVTGLDIGREFFGNIREICAFVIPGNMVERIGRSGPPAIPNAGVILAVNDVAKSRALWDQFLSIPGLVSGKEPKPPKTVTISDTPVTAYSIPEFGKIYLVQLDDCIAVAATRNTAKAVIQAYKTKKTVQEDAAFAKVLAKMPKDTTAMFVAHCGRLAKVAAGANPAAGMVAGPAEELCSDMVAWGAVGQSRNQMTLRMALTGLPNLNKAIKQYGPMMTAIGSAALAAGPQRAKAAAEPKAQQDVNNLTSKMMAAHDKKDYQAMLEYALQARELADTGLTNYNVACAYSLLGEKDKAFQHLFRAAEQGVSGVGQDVLSLMKTDTDLDNLRGDPRFEKAMTIAKEKAGTTAKAGPTKQAQKPAARQEEDEEEND
ncbi:MAG TPA: hypothetical protein VMV94_12685 [Phycisphaerae bacterium]|nr:hypothetical protein [Phycisphaerae bacterium]